MLWESDRYKPYDSSVRCAVSFNDVGRTTHACKHQNGSSNSSYSDLHLSAIRINSPVKVQATNDELQHKGVLGMKWGVITKEYVKKGRNYVSARKKAAKMQSDQAYQQGREWGYKRAMRSLLMRKRLARLKKEYKEQHPDPDIVDKLVKRAADKMGLGQYANVVSSKAKEFATDKTKEFLSTDKGKAVAQKVVNAAAISTAFLLKKSMPVIKFAKDNIPKYTVRGAKALAKITAKVGGASVRWLKAGGARKIQKGAIKLAQLVNRYGSTAISYFGKGAEIISKSGMSGARTASRALLSLMRRRR